MKKLLVVIVALATLVLPSNKAMATGSQLESVSKAPLATEQKAEMAVIKGFTADSLHFNSLILAMGETHNVVSNSFQLDRKYASGAKAGNTVLSVRETFNFLNRSQSRTHNIYGSSWLKFIERVTDRGGGGVEHNNLNIAG